MKLGRYIIGLISGLTFGMLFAPKKGTELRKELLDKSAESGTEGLKVLGGAFKGAGKEALKELKCLSEHEQVAAFLDLSQEKMKNFLEAAEEKGYDVAAAVQEKLESLTAFVKGKTENAKEEAINFKNEVAEKAAAVKKNVAFKKRKLGHNTKNAVKKAAFKKGEGKAAK